MRDKKETILLDARLRAVIDKHAFDAELCNGHRLVAFFRGKLREASPAMSGSKVKVELSPFDMSKGWIVSTEDER
jgi:translation initiation factor IF-1